MSAVLQAPVESIAPTVTRPAGLYPHQVTGVEFLRTKGRAILADDMGLGKTRQAIEAMRQAAPTGVVLIVCPASVKLNWKREILLVDPHAEVDVLGVRGHESAAPRWVIVNYDLLRKHAERLHGIRWVGVIVDEAHFIKNASQRSSHVLKLLGVSDKDRRAAVQGPSQVYLLTGTPIPNRPRDLFNLLRAVGHPAGRSFLSFARRYCGAYRNDFGWVTDGASNLGELNLLLKEVMLRRKKEDVLELPPKIRSYVPVEAPSATAFTAQLGFLSWLNGRDASRPNDREFLGRLQKVRVALHKAKQAACAERIRDVLATGQKVVVFTCYSEGLKRHKAKLGRTAVTITGADSAEERMVAVDAFQSDPEVRVALCNLIAGGVGITLTAGTHVIFQDLDWVPANHRQAEDRCYRLGQDRQVTVEYLLADGTLDGYIARLLEAKIGLIDALEGDAVPDASILAALEQELQALAPALLAEMRSARAPAAEATRIQIIGEMVAALPATSPIVQEGQWEFPSSKDPRKSYRVTFGSAGHLECTCPGFEYRGECKHVREVRASVLK
jgi:SWI/SNF-related matrix-associated actin-dependent regulator of chromatin subfamily A-like protein 1